MTGPPPVKRRSLTVAGVVFAATARAPCYLVSRSMTSNATSKVMASAYIASGIATPFSGGTTPELSGEEMHPQHPTSHKSMLGFAWDSHDGSQFRHGSASPARARSAGAGLRT